MLWMLAVVSWNSSPLMNDEINIKSISSISMTERSLCSRCTTIIRFYSFVRTRVFLFFIFFNFFYTFLFRIELTVWTGREQWSRREKKIIWEYIKHHFTIKKTVVKLFIKIALRALVSHKSMRMQFATRYSLLAFSLFIH